MPLGAFFRRAKYRNYSEQKQERIFWREARGALSEYPPGSHPPIRCPAVGT